MLTLHEFMMLIMSSFVVALCSICYINVLSLEKCCNWWWKFGMQWEGKWFWEPIWGCHKCAAGQIALWSYLVYCFDIQRTGDRGIHVFGSFINPNFVEVREYSLWIHLAYILLSILFSAVLNQILQKRNLI